MMIGEAIDLSLKRLRVRVRGTVQGVGFRPFVHGLARRYDLSGFVFNDSDGVVVEVEGTQTERFVTGLTAEAPPLARIDAIEIGTMAPTGERDFAILSSKSGQAQTRIPADAAICDECLHDLFDPTSRFYLYPFVTCTHCGPRYTMTRRVPYDRPQTAMAGFPLCPACARDYGDPTSRRYHAESLACPICGPKLSHSIAGILATLERGEIVALKGIGGYHLLCDGRNEEAIMRLRQRKQRDAKPFAVMVADMAAARKIADIDDREQHLLSHRARPIMLLKSRHVLPPAIAPNLGSLGVVLPYAPLHHLLFEKRDASAPDRVLVVTSANPGGEPLITDDREAELCLSSIADLIVSHDRPIVVRADDSVMAVHQSGPVFLRRARGFAPDPIDLKSDGPSVLALGAHLKVTVTVTRGREAFMSQHVGSMDNRATIAFFEESVRHLLALTGVTPERVICDLHPDLYSTQFADRFDAPVIAVQHHAAHVAAVMAEHCSEGPVLGVALDGHGYGVDGAAWGGELIVVDGPHWRRVGHLAPLPMPGGERAAREPWRKGLAALHRLGRLDGRFQAIAGAAEMARLMPRLTMPETSSLGRLFDAAAALLGLCLIQHYEGQAAMQLESKVRQPRLLHDGFILKDGVLDMLPLLKALAEPGLSPTLGADLFHGTLAEALTGWIVDRAAALGLTTVALGGGCMINWVLADLLSANLTKRGLRVLLPSNVPAGDGGLSLGQAYLGRRQACA